MPAKKRRKIITFKGVDYEDSDLAQIASFVVYWSQGHIDPYPQNKLSPRVQFLLVDAHIAAKRPFGSGYIFIPASVRESQKFIPHQHLPHQVIWNFVRAFAHPINQYLYAEGWEVFNLQPLNSSYFSADQLVKIYGITKVLVAHKYISTTYLRLPEFDKLREIDDEWPSELGVKY